MGISLIVVYSPYKKENLKEVVCFEGSAIYVAFIIYLEIRHYESKEFVLSNK